jgi:hypothetical protein
MAVGDSYTVYEARGFIYETFYTAWTDPDTGWQFALGMAADDPNAPKVIWDAQDPDDDTPVQVVEAYVTVRHTDGQQGSLRSESGLRWTRKGFLSCRLRFPPAMQLKTADAVTKVVVDAFKGKRAIGDGSGIWFRQVREVEQGINQARNRQDVLAYFTYDEIS